MADPARDRFAKVLAALLDVVRAPEASELPDRQRLYDRLAAVDLDASDLGDMLEWLVELWWDGSPAAWLVAEETGAPSPRSERLLVEAERRYLSPEAQGYLVGLRQSGQISWRQFEMLVHLASLGNGARLCRSDVDRLLDQIVTAEMVKDGSSPRPGNRTH